jgi:hypothetical protein
VSKSQAATAQRALESELADLKKQSIPKSRLATMPDWYGRRPGPVFQTFAGAKYENHVSWAWKHGGLDTAIDYNTNPAQPDGKYRYFLKATFRNAGNDWSSNLAIRSEKEQAIEVDRDKFHWLAFEAHLPATAKADVYLAARLVDANMTHWRYRTAGKTADALFLIKPGEDWKTCYINLDDPGKWRKFEADGNVNLAAEIPDFSVLRHLVLTFGLKDGTEGPIGGEGVVHIAYVRLEEKGP